MWTTSIHSLEDDAARARWDDLWDGSLQRSVFSSWTYAQAAARAFGLRVEMHLAAHDGRVEGGALVFWKQRGPYRIVVQPPFTQYTPLVLRDPPRDADVHQGRSVLDALLDALATRYHVLRFLCNALGDVRPASWRGWRISPLFTYLLDLAGDDDLLMRWSSSTRNLYRKHTDTFVVEERDESVRAVVDLAAVSYARHDRSMPGGVDAACRLAEALCARGKARCFTATQKEDGAVDAGLIVLFDNRTAHYWIAGSQPGPAMTVLLGQVLPRLRQQGVRCFDFVGANTPSIAQFKRQFGPSLSTYCYLEKITRPELRLLRLVYDRF